MMESETKQALAMTAISLVGLFLGLLLFAHLVNSAVEGFEESDRVENCEDGKPNVLTGKCSNDGHKLIVEDGVALCRCPGTEP